MSKISSKSINLLADMQEKAMTLDQRVEALEKEVADLKERLALLGNATSHSIIQLQKAISTTEKKSD